MNYPALIERFSAQILPFGSTAESQARFQAIARYASARAGDAPFTANDRDQIAFVARGSTKLVAQASQGREQVVAFHFAGDLVSIPARAARMISTVNRLDDWRFSEWLHGRSGEVSGMPGQTWNAATFLLADHALRHRIF